VIDGQQPAQLDLLKLGIGICESRLFGIVVAFMVVF
jgi:hypothetical protein